ncbi:MAG: glycine--tRNA ligase [Phycisphaerae bacterium]
MANPTASKMDKIVALCKRRGFIFQSSEIYGGINGFWDYGPLGVELKRNIKEAWWQDMVRNPPAGPDGREVQMVGVDCSIIMNPKVWEASGHATGFADPMVECGECQGRFRADKVFFFQASVVPPALAQFCQVCAVEADSVEEAEELYKAEISRFARKNNVIDFKGELQTGMLPRAIGFRQIRGERGEAVEYQPPVRADNETFFQNDQAYSAVWPCPRCKNIGSLTAPRRFNLMFKSHAGAMETSADEVFLRPETAQGIFVNFKNVCDSTRVKIPFGIAQVGKAFRNEINPRNYTFRSREFEQMEIEFFCHDKDAMKWWEWWRDTRINWYKSLGLASDHLRPRNQTDKELAHYSKACTDIEYLFPFSDEPQELEGVAHRGCFDLTQHAQHSGKDLTYFDDESKERFLPTVIEPSAGADRAALAFICEAYTEDPARPSPELMKFHPRLAPIKAAIFPLVNKDGLPEVAEPIFRAVKKLWPAQYDPKASIGKRYARMDEAGTPFCFTIDGQTKEDNTVTVRDRDTGAQQRIDKGRVVEFLRDKLSSST